MSEDLKKLMEKEKKFFRNSKICIIVILVGLVLQLFPSSLNLWNIFRFFSSIIGAVGIYLTIKRREEGLLIKQSILVEITHLMTQAGMMTMDSYVKLAKKYEDKKSRLEDLIGPDYEDINEEK
jgi:predicted XRE-type DNA-binding protein